MSQKGRDCPQMSAPLRLWLLVLLTSLVSCRRDGLEEVSSVLRFDPPTLQFEPSFADGVTRRQEVSILNQGRATLDVAWQGLGRAG